MIQRTMIFAVHGITLRAGLLNNPVIQLQGRVGDLDTDIQILCHPALITDLHGIIGIAVGLLYGACAADEPGAGIHPIAQAKHNKQQLDRYLLTHINYLPPTVRVLAGPENPVQENYCELQPPILMNGNLL
jgi:hypothetical protein